MRRRSVSRAFPQRSRTTSSNSARVAMLSRLPIASPARQSPPAGSRSTEATAQRRVAVSVRQCASARRFTELVHACCVGSRDRPEAAPEGLEAWMRDARGGGRPAVETLAADLEQDAAAVRSALTTPWSNGQTEGRIARLKLLKRQMYGRAGLALLRRRMLLAA